MTKFHNNKLKTVGLHDNEGGDMAPVTASANNDNTIVEANARGPRNSSTNRPAPSGYASYINQANGMQDGFTQSLPKFDILGNQVPGNAPTGPFQPAGGNPAYNFNGNASALPDSAFSNDRVHEAFGFANDYNHPIPFVSPAWLQSLPSNSFPDFENDFAHDDYDRVHPLNLAHHGFGYNPIAPEHVPNNYGASNNVQVQTPDSVEDHGQGSELKAEDEEDEEYQMEEQQIDNDSSDYDGDEVDAQPAPKRQKTNKNGAPRKPRQPRAKLCSWKDDDWKNVLLGVVQVCGANNIRIPFEQAAKFAGPTVTAGALQQAILKLRDKQIAEGYEIPALKMNWTRKETRDALKAANAQQIPQADLGKPKVTKKKPTRKRDRQSLVITLYRAYQEGLRTHLVAPYDFNKVGHNEQHVRGRSSAITSGNQNAQKGNKQALRIEIPPRKIEHNIPTHSNAIIAGGNPFTPLPTHPTSPAMPNQSMVNQAQAATYFNPPQQAFSSFDNTADVGKIANRGPMCINSANTSFGSTTGTAAHTPASTGTGTFTNAFPAAFGTPHHVTPPSTTPSFALGTQFQTLNFDGPAFNSPEFNFSDFSSFNQDLAGVGLNDQLMAQPYEVNQVDDAPAPMGEADDIFSQFLNE